jgi:predicted ATPase
LTSLRFHWWRLPFGTIRARCKRADSTTVSENSGVGYLGDGTYGDGSHFHWDYAQNRFQATFVRFLCVFARAEHPLALFLDDLQWLDTATLELLERLVTEPDVHHLLLIGAYRDNEVIPPHPLLRTLAKIRRAGVAVEEIVLVPLSIDDMGQLVLDSLHCEPDRARPLAQLMQEKTGGNPFFAIQFFSALAEEGLVSFDPVSAARQWNIDHIRAKSYTDNVVDLMAGKLRRFSAPTRQALKHLASLGNLAEIATLSLILGETEERVHAALWEPVQAGLVFRRDSAYRFLHDRIQQAAYTLFPEEDRAEVHLRIRTCAAGQHGHRRTRRAFVRGGEPV